MESEKGMLHGKHTLEDKTGLSGNEANMVDAKGDMGHEVRKAVALDYVHGGDDIESKIAEFKKMNSEIIDHSEIDELYPTHKD